MAQKTNPIILRQNKNKFFFDEIYFNYYNYGSLLLKNFKIKNYINYILKKSNVSSSKFVIIHLHNKTIINVFYCVLNKYIKNSYALNKTNFPKKIKYLKKNVDIENYTKIKKNFPGKIKNCYLTKNYKNNLNFFTILNYFSKDFANFHAKQTIFYSKNFLENKNFTKNKKMKYIKDMFTRQKKLNYFYTYNYYRKLLYCINIKFFIIKYFYNMHLLNNYKINYNKQNKFFSQNNVYCKNLQYFSINNQKNSNYLNNILFSNFFTFHKFDLKKYVFLLMMQKIQNKNLKNIYIKNIYKKNKINNFRIKSVSKNSYAKYKKILNLYYNYLLIKNNNIYVNKSENILKKNLENKLYIFFYNKYYVNNFFFKANINKNKLQNCNLFLQKYSCFLKKNTVKNVFLENIFFYVLFFKKLNFNQVNLIFFRYVLYNLYNKKLKNKHNINFFKKHKSFILNSIFNLNLLKNNKNKNILKKNNFSFSKKFNLYNFNNYNANFTFKNNIENYIYNLFLCNNTLQFFKCNNAFTNTIFLMDLIVYMYEKKYTFFKIKKFLLKNIIYQKKLNIKGIKLIVSGVVGGKSKKAQKAKTQTFIYGETSLHVFNEKIDFFCKKYLTVFGILGIKIWICYEKN